MEHAICLRIDIDELQDVARQRYDREIDDGEMRNVIEAARHYPTFDIIIAALESSGIE